MPLYHFSLGDSTDGPVGVCAAIRARSRKEAVARLRSELPLEVPVASSVEGERAGVEYMRVYLNPKAIALESIDFVEDRGATPN